MIFKGLFKGQSLSRVLFHYELKDIKLSGNIIDLGAKSGKSSYYEFLNVSDEATMLYTDLYAKGDSVMKVDLEKEIPVPNISQDFLLLFNVLEHLYDYNKCCEETFRILKKGGKLYGVVPFLYRFHPDPDDFYRYTDSALKRIFLSLGFSKIEVKPLGYGPFTVIYSQLKPFIFIRFFRPFLAFLAIFLDKTLNVIFSNHPAIKKGYYPLSYYFVATK